MRRRQSDFRARRLRYRPERPDRRRRRTACLFTETGIDRSHTSSTQVVYYNGLAARASRGGRTSLLRPPDNSHSLVSAHKRSHGPGRLLSFSGRRGLRDAGQPQRHRPVVASLLPIAGSCSLKPATSPTTASDCVLDAPRP